MFCPRFHPCVKYLGVKLNNDKRVALLVLSILRSYAIGLEIRLTEFLFLFIVVFGLCVAITLSRPTALERKIRILDISPDFGMMLIYIKNSEYAEELLHLNPMSAERISLNHLSE